ncbi:MAG: hypothetical protein JO090_02220 [Rhizobacter sp.]|nr:hypothetical protein [Rhizobacter sp.]
MARRPAFDEIRALHWVGAAVAECARSAGAQAGDARPRIVRRQADGRAIVVQSVALAGGTVLHTFSEAD